MEHGKWWIPVHKRQQHNINNILILGYFYLFSSENEDWAQCELSAKQLVDLLISRW